jgi:6-phosphogluconolactonase (cycloisomerase 2 family)
MLIANYATGTVSALPRGIDGSLAAPAAILALPGKPGPDPVQQRSSHPHQVAWDPAGRFVVVPDKGTDQVFVLRFDPDDTRFEICGRFATRPGSGPRHIAFHPTRPYAFVAYELSSEVGVYGYDAQAGTLDLRAVHRTVPAGAPPGNTAAEILVTADGSEVLVTNRGHDSIYRARFVAERDTLEGPSWTSCGGRGPRFASFGPRPDQLLVANELSDNICAFDLSLTGRPTRAAGSEISTGSPVCIVMGRIAADAAGREDAGSGRRDR